MAAIMINDLPANRALDHKAMSLIRGASGGPMGLWMDQSVRGHATEFWPGHQLLANQQLCRPDDQPVSDGLRQQYGAQFERERDGG